MTKQAQARVRYLRCIRVGHRNSGYSFKFVRLGVTPAVAAAASGPAHDADRALGRPGRGPGAGGTGGHGYEMFEPRLARANLNMSSRRTIYASGWTR